MQKITYSNQDFSQDIYVFDQPKQPKAVIHLVHGLFEYGMRYQDIAEIFVHFGFVVLSHDLPGHGSQQVEQGLIDFENHEVLLQSVRHVKDYMINEYANLKHILVAQELGSMIAQTLLQKERNLYDQVFLLSPTLLPKSKLARWRCMSRVISLFKKPLMPSEYLSRLVLDKPYRRMRKNGIINEKHEWFTTDKAMQKEYLSDAKMGYALSLRAHKAVIALYQESKRYQKLKKQASSMPIHFFCGDQDAYCDYGNHAKALYSIYFKKGYTNLHFSVYQDARHELFREVQRQKVVTDITDYIHKKLFK